MVGDKEYPAVSGKTKKDAKEAAARLVYDMICGSKTTEVSYTHISSGLIIGPKTYCVIVSHIHQREHLKTVFLIFKTSKENCNHASTQQNVSDLW